MLLLSREESYAGARKKNLLLSIKAALLATSYGKWAVRRHFSHLIKESNILKRNSWHKWQIN